MAHIKLNIAKMMSNYHFLNKLCQQQNIEFIPVTKGILSSFEVCQALYDVGCRMVADAHWQNFASWPKPLPLKKMLLQVSPSQVEQALHYGDIFMVSDLSLLDAMVQKAGQNHLSFLLPIEVGEGRDGILPQEIEGFLQKALPLAFVQGFAFTFGCVKGLCPETTDLNWIESFCQKHQKQGNFLNSLGGTTFIDLLLQGKLDQKAHQLRLGEALFFGYNTYTKSYIQELHNDAITLTAEILEVREKEEDVCHLSGFNSFGIKEACSIQNKKPEKRLQAVLDIGFFASLKNQIDQLPQGISFLANSHDHLILDITHSSLNLKAGDSITITPRYDFANYCMMQPHVSKILV